MPPDPKQQAKRPSLFLSTLSLPFRIAWLLFIVIVPLLGMWLGSSLTAFFNGPVWLALAAGLLLFPILPLAWDAWANVKRRKTGKKARFGFRGRLLARTLVLNLAVIAGLLIVWPQGSFTALSTHGDWALESREDQWASTTRRGLFWAADRLEWLYLVARDDNPFEDFAKVDDDAEPVPTPVAAARFVPQRVDRSDRPAPAPEPPPPPPPPPSAVVSVDAGVAGTDAGAIRIDETTGETTIVLRGDSAPKVEHPPADADEPPKPSGDKRVWPAQATLHPIVSKIPQSEQSSPEAVARYIAAHVRDPYERVKAIHDYIADRVAYDAVALAANNIPDQDPNVVFTKKVGVCAGYARLFEVMYESIGGTAVFVAGESRDTSGDISGGGHAWNAIAIEGKWYLIDVTWDAGSVKGTTFTKRYSSDYLFTPPEIFAMTHFPTHEKWQLLEKPISRGDFLRQPMLRPSFFAKGLRLVSPQRSHVTVDGKAFDVVLDNPGDFYLIGVVQSKAGGAEQRCKTAYVRNQARISCNLPDAGEFVMRMFGSQVQYESYGMIGQIEVNSRG